MKKIIQLSSHPVTKLWGGRFSKSTSRTVERFTHALNVDQRMAREDLLGSIAHARMLGKTRIIPSKDSARLVKVLTSMLRDLDRGKLRWDSKAEDIHSAIQTLIEKRAGPAAQRLHTARSRNDQVVTSFRLHSARRIDELNQRLLTLQKKLLGQARSAGNLVMPGYTHWRHAQPVLVSHLLLSYLEMFQRDRERLQETGRRTLAELPLGSGALAGSSLPINRNALAKELGFTGIKQNSIDGVTDRDFAAELLGDLSLLGIHLSRIAEEWILFSTTEFGFLSFNETMLTGSSMMPQKQNPDFLELIRANSAKLIGDQTSFITLLKGLPSGYSRDLQLDKEILFDALDRAEGMVETLADGASGLRWNRKALAAQLEDDSLYATDLAEYLVKKGLRFAQAHRVIGQLLTHTDRAGKRLSKLSPETFRRFSPAFGRDVLKLFNPAVSVARKRSAGSTHPAQVAQQIQRWELLLSRNPKEAVRRIRELRRGIRLGGLSIRKLINEGRRF